MSEHDEGSDVDGIVEDMADQLARQLREISLFDDGSAPRRTWLHDSPYCRCVLEWPAITDMHSVAKVTVHVAPECRLHGEGTETLAYLQSIEAQPDVEPSVESRYDFARNEHDATISLTRHETIVPGLLAPRQLPSGDNELHG